MKSKTSIALFSLFALLAPLPFWDLLGLRANAATAQLFALGCSSDRK